MASPLSEVQWVEAQTIRDLFKESQYPERMRSGELNQEIIKRSHLQNPGQKRMPVCTHSEVLLYTSHDNKEFVIVHQYLKPDGTLGASGKPDPKKIRIGDGIYATR